MIKSVTALSAALLAGCVLAGSAPTATARCSACGPIPPQTYYKTVHPAQYYTRYRDVSVYNRVNRVRQIFNVTRVQPIVYINEVTRVHHHTIVQVSNAYQDVTQYVAPLTYVYRSVQHYYDCGCGQ